MSDERIPQNQPEDELSDEQLEQISGGDGNGQQPTLTATSNGDSDSAAPYKNEIHIEFYSWGAPHKGT